MIAFDGLHCLGCGDDTHALTLVATSPSADTPDAVAVVICEGCLDRDAESYRQRIGEDSLIDKVWRAVCMPQVRVVGESDG